jgi:tRNA A64-2'-O-ribosylphosphate transferase
MRSTQGLTADVFWGHSDTILAASRDECDSVIAFILSSLPSSSSPTSHSTPIRTTRISLAFATESPSTPSPTTSTIFIQPTLLDPTPSLDSSTRTIVARMGKKGYHAFFASLEPALAFAEEGLRSDRTVEIVTGVSESQSDANDLGIAVALVLLGESSSGPRGGVLRYLLA